MASRPRPGTPLFVPDSSDQAAFGRKEAIIIEWTLPSDCDGLRADAALVARVKRLSRTRAQELIKRGDFRTKAGPLKPSQRLREGTELELWRLPPDEAEELETVPRVIHRDHDLLVVDKPGDLAVHPSARYYKQTLTQWLKTQRDDGGRLAHPCHRLDRETSGVQICAWHKASESTVKTAFADGGVTKTYLAIVDGVLERPFICERPLALQGERGLVRIKMIHDDAGLPSSTRFVPLRTSEIHRRTLVACRPLTGRQHQIRAHLALCGHPIVGDKLYSMGEAWFDRFTIVGMPDDEAEQPAHGRQALHATRAALELAGERRVFTALLPDELGALMGLPPDTLEHPFADEAERRLREAFGP